jgi:hypothetical protein
LLTPKVASMRQPMDEDIRTFLRPFIAVIKEGRDLTKVILKTLYIGQPKLRRQSNKENHWSDH